jgi:hypothetical protein
VSLEDLKVKRTINTNLKVYVLCVKRSFTTMLQEVKGVMFQTIPKEVPAVCFMRGTAQSTECAFN